jgi:alpha-D-xyloside xylohydrolase
LTVRIWLVLLVAACGDNVVQHSATLTSGAATLTFDAGTLTLAQGGVQRLVFGTDAFRVGTVDDLDSGDSFDPYWLFVDMPPEAPAGLAWHGGTLRLASADDAHLAIAVDGATITFTPEGTDGFAAEVATTAKQVAYVQVAPDADGHEGFYGLGEWPDVVDHRGTLRPMQMELDTTAEGADNEDHVPVPLVIGTTGWGMFVESRRPGAFEIARASDTRVTATYGTDALAFHLFTAAAPLDVLGRYFDVTGYPGLPAPWALGPLIWRDENASQAQVIDDIQQIRSRHLATTGVWFDRPYSTGVETFDWEATKFPDPHAMLSALHNAGLRYGIWQTPYTANASNADPAQSQLDYATAHGFFPPKTGVLVNPWGPPIDLTNADAYAWWQQNLRAYTDGDGVEGFKLDYAEDVVLGVLGKRTPWLFHDGSDERTMHYDYQLLYHRIHRELLPAEGGLLLTRTGRWGDQVHGMIIWPGDLDASFAHAGDAVTGQSTLAVGGLPAAVTKGIGLSASGFPFYASDTGGYRHSPPGRELWLRWVEANAVMPAMEVGDSSSQTPWEFTAANGRDQAALDTYARYASLHLRLYPYTWTYAQQMASTGRPIERPLGLAYPALAAHPADEYALGDSIVVAPVVAAGQTSREVLLPPGDWLSWWDGSPHTGTITAPADLDTLPLYLARGAIIPLLRPTIETLSPVTSATIDSFATDAGLLYARIAPGPASSFTVYDGTQLAQAPGTVTYTPGTVFTTGVMFEVIATPQPASVGTLTQQSSLAALQAAPDGWFWEPATGGTLWIKTGGGTVSY